MSTISDDTNMSDPSAKENFDVPMVAKTLLADLESNEPSLICLSAPRRRHGDGSAAAAIAGAMYPELSPLAAMIKYEAGIVALRKSVLERQRAEEKARRDAKGYTHRENVRKQGAWDPPASFWTDDDADHEDESGFAGGKQGVPAIPMPVSVAKVRLPNSLSSFRSHMA
jgi:hypothetical protein